MTQGEEDNENKRPQGQPQKPNEKQTRKPLAQLSERQQQSQYESSSHSFAPALPAAAAAIPESSTYEVTEPRDWILPVPQDKSEVLDQDWKQRNQDMIQDLSYCVDVNNSTIIDDEDEEEGSDVDVSDILGELQGS